MKWKMARTKKSGQMTSEASNEIANKIVSDSHLLVVIFYNNCWMSKPNLFHLLTTRFPGRASLIGKLYCPWTSGCIDYCHWTTRTPSQCPCCWSRCHDQTILWNDFKEIPHIYVHGSQRPGAYDTKNQGPSGGVDHIQSDSKTNVVL